MKPHSALGHVAPELRFPEIGMKGGDQMADNLLTFADGFADYKSEVESKGWFADARLTHSGQSYRLNFYDP